MHVDQPKPGESCVISSEGERILQQRASLSKRLGYLTRQIGPRVGMWLAAELGLLNRELDTSVMLAKNCLPQLVVSASLEYQCS